MKKTIIVMPVANEEDTMEKILDEILALPYDNLYIYPVIDSYSKDRTEEIIRRKAAYNDRVKCIFYRESRGVISCYLEGFRQALKDGAEQILEMDGGGSHLPAEIPQFLTKLEEGYDCVWGSRFMEGGSMRRQPLYRRILSQGGTFLANFVLGTRLKDMTSLSDPQALRDAAGPRFLLLSETIRLRGSMAADGWSTGAEGAVRNGGDGALL